MKTIEQLRAQDAMKQVAELSGKPDGFKKLYRAYVDRLGPTIVMNGLGQALAMEPAASGPKSRTQGEKAHYEIYCSLQRWICRENGGVYPSANDLLHAITENDESDYLCAQAEALAWLEWHKKCCRASLPKGEENAE